MDEMRMEEVEYTVDQFLDLVMRLKLSTFTWGQYFEVIRFAMRRYDGQG
jgi:hypothetical protein